MKDYDYDKARNPFRKALRILLVSTPFVLSGGVLALSGYGIYYQESNDWGGQDRRDAIAYAHERMTEVENINPVLWQQGEIVKTTVLGREAWRVSFVNRVSKKIACVYSYDITDHNKKTHFFRDQAICSS